MGLPHPQADSKLLREHNFYDEPADSGAAEGSSHVGRHHCNLSALNLAVMLLVVVIMVKMHYVLKSFYSGYLNRSHGLPVMGSPKSPSKLSMSEKTQVDDLV